MISRQTEVVGEHFTYSPVLERYADLPRQVGCPIAFHVDGHDDMCVGLIEVMAAGSDMFIWSLGVLAFTYRGRVDADDMLQDKTQLLTADSRRICGKSIFHDVPRGLFPT